MIKRIIKNIQHFFGISRKEARAALLLMILSFCLIWTPFIFRRWILPLVPISPTPINTKKIDSIAAELDREIQTDETEKGYQHNFQNNTPRRPIRLFPFDPNIATTDQMEELGIPRFLASRIEKYRIKGGQFRKKDDLLHIYDFPADLYLRLESYIVLKKASAEHIDYRSGERKPLEKPAGVSYNKEVKTYNAPSIPAFDINTADTTQLVRLKGIGSKLSVRILKFRDALGGFHATTQFSEIYGLDSLALSELNKYGRIQSPVKKLNINTATPEQLSSHSYLRNKKIVQVIVNYRDQHGPYSSIDDLKKIKVLDESTLAKIAPYLMF